MTDHYLHAIERLDEVAQHRKELAALHVSQRGSASQIAAKYDSIRVGLKLADIHAKLAEVQALHDLRAVLEAGDRTGLARV